jgi:hypothetical protein
MGAIASTGAMAAMDAVVIMAEAVAVTVDRC